MNLFERIKAKIKPKAKQKCPLEKGTIVVVLTRTDTGKPIQGATADVKGPTPGNGSTDDLGAVILTERDVGAYTAAMTLPGSLKGFKFTQETKEGSVSADSTEILTWYAAPIGHLKVEVYDDLGKLLPEAAAISSSGPQSVSENALKGKHTFNNIIAGKYQVSASVSAEHYEPATVSKADVEVPPGGTGYVRLEVKRLVNIVKPKIEVEYKVVVLDRKLSAHQETSETKIVTDDVTFVQLSVTQSTGIPAYTGHGTFAVSPANVDVYIDEACKNLLGGRKITNDELASGSFRVYLKAKTAGKFKAKLTLDPSNDPAHIKVEAPAEEEMGVVELEMKVHRYVKSDIDALAVKPDVDPYEKYYTELEGKKLPDQKPLTDAQKVKEGRLLHAQKDNNHARAKLVLQKLKADQWPGGTDDYDITISEGNASGSVTLFDKDWKGTEQKPVHKVKVKDLKAKEIELWAEGKETTKKLRDVVLDLGVNRAKMGSPHTSDYKPKRNGDWGRFSVVEIKEVKVDYTPENGKAVAWDTTSHRFCINYKADPDGRKVTIAAALSEPVKGITLHFMLAEDSGNMKAANWVLDLPTSAGPGKEWKWSQVKAEVKHKDKDDRKKLLHMSHVTDDKGEAKKELTLSRFGGDKFHPAAYIDQDPHLAKFVAGHAKLGVRKPKTADHPIEVWRQFWAQIIRVAGATFPGTVAAEGQYTRVKSTMERTPDVVIPRATVNGMNPPAIYPKYMVYVGGGTSDAVVVSDTNKSQFFTGVAAEADKPIKIPILVCDAQWDPGGHSGAVSGNALATAFPIPLDVGTLVIDPPLQGGKLFVSGKWRARDPGSQPGKWKNSRGGDLADGDVSIDENRTDLKHVVVKVPAGVAPVAGTKIWIDDLVIQGADPDGPYLGEYDPGTKQILAVYNQKTQADKDDFDNTIVHEVGHAFSQIMHNQTEGIPKHPNQKDLGQGNHCRHLKNKCVMYDSGPIKGSLSIYCDVCHPYLQLVDMHTLS